MAKSAPLVNRREFMRSAGAVAAVPLAVRYAAAQDSPESAPFPFVDGLSFLPESSQEVRQSGLSAFFLDVSAPEAIKTDDGSIRYYRSFEACARSITRMRRRLRTADWSSLFLGRRAEDVREAHRTGRTAVFFQFQGCEPLGEDLTRLDLFYELGLRILQITHHNDNPFGGGALEAHPKGLSQLGFDCVTRMNEMGIIPDISHSSNQTALDTLKASNRPVILSHGAAREIVRNARCATDEVIRGVADSGGVMGIFMMSFWLTLRPQPTVEDYVRQIRHVINIGGLDAAGIANDFPISGQMQLIKMGNDNAKGVEGYLPWWKSVAKEGVLGFDRLPEHVVIPELNNVRRMFHIDGALRDAGFTLREREKIMGGNWIRVLRESFA